MDRQEIERRLDAAGAAKVDAAHHRLPQFYLRGFASPQREVGLLRPNTGVYEVIPVKRALAEPGYYTIVTDEAGTRSAILEELYSFIESDAARQHRALAEGLDPAEFSAEDRWTYALFLAAQVTRGQRFLELDAQMSDQLGKLTLQMAARRPDEYWKAKREAAEAAGEEPPPELTPEVRRWIERGEFEVTSSSAMKANLRINSLDEMTSVFVDMSWHVVTFDRPSLLTSEHPVTYWRRPSPTDHLYGIGPMTSDEVRFPLTPTKGLVLSHPRHGLRSGVSAGDRRRAKLFNWSTILWARDLTVVMNPQGTEHPLPTLELIPSFRTGGRGPAWGFSGIVVA